MMSDNTTPLEYREKLLDAVLPHVAFDGWSNKALFMAAEDIGISKEMAELAFPDGALELIEAHLAQADKQLAQALTEKNLPEMKIRDRITTAVRTRFELASDYKDAVRKGVAFLAQPQYAAVGAKALWKTCDIMWRCAGDKSMDHNWYTKRMTLSAVYSAVLTFWLNDDSENHAETWAFLDRRIEDVMKIETAKFQFKEATKHMPSLTRFLGRLRYPAT